ncbi:MAG: gliding motility-associated C-terminal domain-containing protein [Bacteroidales bacterium]|nr:gliding motility-associated C-terminal domain-containing protein [Bacteroidales bacterium]
MRKKRISYILFLIVSTGLTGQAPPWDWVKPLYTSQEEIAADVIADPATGNVYLVGRWQGSLDGFIPGGGTPSTNFSDTYGGNDGLVAKYSPAGNLLWAFKIGGGDHDNINAIHLDMDGSIYITGSASVGTIHFTGTGSVTPDSFYSNTDGDDFFLAKYDLQGKLLWMRHSDGVSWTEGRGITSNSSGVYVTGAHVGIVSFGPLPPHTADGNSDLFVVKYTPDGDEQWHIWGSSNMIDYGEDIACDETHIYVTGEFEGSILSLSNAAGNIISTLFNANAGLNDLFIASYTIDGLHQWTRAITSDEENFSLGITMDSDSIYLAGSIGAPAFFPSFSGNPVSHNNQQDAFICSMSKSNGATGWVHTLRGEWSGDQVARDISMDIFGNLYVTGYYTLSIDNMYEIFDNQGWEDIFLVSYTNDGKFRWIKTAGSSQPDFGNGVSATASGCVYISGNYTELASFDSIFIPGNVNKNMYLARLQLPCLEAVGGVLSTTDPVVCEADTIRLMLKDYYGDIEWQTSPPGLNSWSTLTADLSDSIVFIPVVSADFRAYLRSGICIPDSSNIINVQVNPLPVVNISGGGDVCGLVDALQATPGFNSGIWSRVSGPGAAFFTPSPDSANVTVTVTDYGSYEFKRTETNGLCTGNSSVVVRFFQQPVIALIPGAKTCGLQYGLNVTSSTDAAGSWSISNGPGSATFLPDEQTPDATVQVDAYGIYTFQWTATSGICSGTAVTDVEFLKVPDVDAGMDMTIDAGEVVQLTGTGGDSVIWTPDYRLSDSSIPDPFADPHVTTTYHLTVFNPNGCSGRDSVVISVRPPDFADAGEDVKLCPGDSINLKASGGDAYKWDPPDGLDQPDIPDPWAKPRITTTYVVSVTRADGVTDTDTVTIVVLPRPFVDAGPDQEYTARFETTLEAKLGTDEKGAWSVVSGNGIFEDPHSPVTWVSDLVIGDNIFAWSVTNEVCPEATDRVMIRVKDFVIPTVITPNGDGKNDYFHVEGIEQFDASELIILNRWGEEVYRTAPYQNDWEGVNSNGRMLPEDTYYTILKIKNDDVRKGYVMIIR